MATRPVDRGTIFFGDRAIAPRLSRATARGEIRRLARGIYSADLTTPDEILVRDNLWSIVAHVIPDALIADRSAALGGRLTADGQLFVISAERARDLELPGLRVAVRPGPPPLDDDPEWLEGLRIASIPRALAENLARTRSHAKRTPRTLRADELEDWVARLAQQYSAERLNRMRDRARAIADRFGLTAERSRLDDAIGAALGTRPAPGTGRLLAARSAGRDWDEARLTGFDALASALMTRIPDTDVPGHLPVDDTTTREVSFFEAYFSNFIEGTEFALDEAVEIVYGGQVPENRPEDAHDVIGTYSLVADGPEMRTLATDADEFVAILCRRHARLMQGRPDAHPGQFKARPNQAGSYVFVNPDLQAGTLREAFPFIAGLTNPLSRALMAMFVVSEVHPFDDGNGRVARVMMNAELVAAGESRIIVPIVFRNEYQSALRRLSRGGDAFLYQRTMGFAWRWTWQMDWSDLAVAKTWLDRTDALVDSTDAAASGCRLLLPADIRSPA